MVLRIILRYLANHEQLVQRLSESYPIRRAAQIAVSYFIKGRSIAQESGLDKRLTPEEFRKWIRLFSDKAQQEYIKAQERLKKKF